MIQTEGGCCFKADYVFFEVLCGLDTSQLFFGKKRLSLFSISPVRYVATCLPKTSDLR